MRTFPKKQLAKAALLLGATVALAGPAFAQSDYCGYLRQQLAAYGSDRGGGADVQGLYRELSAMSAQANAYGCQRGFFLFGPTGGPQCGAILNRIDALQSAIANAQRGNRGFGWSSFSSEPARIRQEMARVGCSSGDGGGGGLGGGGRTLCVRVCDGYYFPISFQANRSQYKKDEAACKALYPDGQAELFVDGQPDGDVQDMVSLSGKHYRDQPYALAYRSSYNASCPLPRGKTASATGQLLPIPIAKPVPNGGEDPETVANRAGDFLLAPRAVTVASAPGAIETTEKSSVRLVGPSYFYARSDETSAPRSASEAPPQTGSLVSDSLPAVTEPEPQSNDRITAAIPPPSN